MPLALTLASFFHIPDSAQTTISIDAAIGIAVGVTAAVVVGVMAGIFLCHCISKHQYHSSKPETSTHQQQQTGPEYEDVSATRVERKIELRENVAYGPAQKIDLQQNEAISMCSVDCMSINSYKRTA